MHYGFVLGGNEKIQGANVLWLDKHPFGHLALVSCRPTRRMLCQGCGEIIPCGIVSSFNLTPLQVQESDGA